MSAEPVAPPSPPQGPRNRRWDDSQIEELASAVKAFPGHVDQAVNWVDERLAGYLTSLKGDLLSKMDTAEENRIAQATLDNFGPRLTLLEAARDELRVRRIGVSAFCALVVSSVFHYLTHFK